LKQILTSPLLHKLSPLWKNGSYLVLLNLFCKTQETLVSAEATRQGFPISLQSSGNMLLQLSLLKGPHLCNEEQISNQKFIYIAVEAL